MAPPEHGGEGIEDFLIVALGKENRSQTRSLVGFGEHLGVRVRYSRVRFDPLNTGSADATIQNLEYFGIEDPALVFPTDSLFEFSLPELVAAHERGGALLTVATMRRTGPEVVGRYGVMITGPGGRVTQFLEKPCSADLRRAVPATDPAHFVLPTNAGMYLVDAPRARALGHHPDIALLRRQRLDFGMDLLPWLASRGVPVHTAPVHRVGDLGTVPGYVDTLVGMLRGAFPSLLPQLGPPLDSERRIWIPPETLRQIDPVSGKTLADKLECGLVEIGDNVRLGRYVEVGPGVRITDSSVDDDVDIGEGADISRSAVRDGARIGPFATVAASYVGSMVEVASSKRHPTCIVGYSALGDQAVIGEGARISGGVRVHPRVCVPAGAAILEGAEVRHGPSLGPGPVPRPDDRGGDAAGDHPVAGEQAGWVSEIRLPG